MFRKLFDKAKNLFKKKETIKTENEGLIKKIVKAVKQANTSKRAKEWIDPQYKVNYGCSYRDKKAHRLPLTKMIKFK